MLARDRTQSGGDSPAARLGAPARASTYTLTVMDPESSESSRSSEPPSYTDSASARGERDGGRYGTVAIARQLKDDGRALILYVRAEPDARD